MDKFRDSELRYWYAAKAAENGWSRAVLEHHILTRLHTRPGPRRTTSRRACRGRGRTWHGRSPRTRWCWTSLA
nr:hypothetical protein [Sinomonas mesophila]